MSKLCNSIILQSSSSWMQALPLLHVLCTPEYFAEKPYCDYNGDLTINSILDILLCKLNVAKFQIKDVKYELTKHYIYFEFYRSTLHSLQPYFKFDWLLPRAFLIVCPFKNIFNFIQDHMELTLFATWQIGMNYLQNGSLKNEDEV